MKIKLYADGADINGMIEEYKKGIVKGFTTNPTLMRKAGVTNYKAFAQEAIRAIPDLPISFEVFSDDIETMAKEAREIASWGNNVYVKIPITTTTGLSTGHLIEALSDDGIKINVTAILTKRQIIESSRYLSEDTPGIISIFAGRIADTGINPIDIMGYAVAINRSDNTEILWASTRELLNIFQAEGCGCDIITVTNDILKKLTMVGKSLDELSLDTVKMFHNDAQAAGYSIL